ncbi:MAG: low molecular weight phosphotyrosine protein phosphatase [Nitrospirae bacterium]|nr:low molecular weight phosphotyrosine protein phosphatase [Nitrospirota bacterium]
MVGSYGKELFFRTWEAVRGSEERSGSREKVRSLPGRARILVVCYGNICRSPVVERLLKRFLDPSRFSVASCGFLPREGEPSPADYALEARAFGVDLSDHRSQYMTTLLADWSDLIVLMDRKNHTLLSDFGSRTLEKAVWLGAWDPEGPIEISDPFRMPPEKMRQILGRMERASRNLAGDLSRNPLPPSQGNS